MCIRDSKRGSARRVIADTHVNGFTASPACVHSTVELADDVRKFLELKLRDFAGDVN